MNSRPSRAVTPVLPRLAAHFMLGYTSTLVIAQAVLTTPVALQRSPRFNAWRREDR